MPKTFFFAFKSQMSKVFKTQCFPWVRIFLNPYLILRKKLFDLFVNIGKGRHTHWYVSTFGCIKWPVP